MSLTGGETEQLRTALREALIKCSERCLYQSAKWYVALEFGFHSGHITYDILGLQNC